MNKMGKHLDMIKIETRLSHALLKNSHDFIRSAIEYANEYDEEHFKFAVLHLCSAIELLLKSRLSEEHWSLVFANQEKAKVSNLQTGDFISVGINTSQKRLKDICNIELSDPHKQIIKTLSRIRNRIVHFHMDINRNLIKGLTAQSLNVYVEFYNSYISPDWEEYSVLGYEICQMLREFKEFVEIRMQTLSIVLKDSKRPKTNYFWECQNCLQDAIILSPENKLECLFCGDVIEVGDIAKFHSEDDSVGICPSCGIKSYILTSTKNDQKNFECIVCGHFEGKPQIWSDFNGRNLPHLRNFANTY